MILIITNREDITADFVVSELKHRKKQFVRFNTEDFPDKVEVKISYEKGSLNGSFEFAEKDFSLRFSSIKSIWYRRPVLPKIAGIPKRYEGFCIRESMTVLNGIWDSLKCFWVSNPRNIYFAENKLSQLDLALKLGFIVPKTIISNRYAFIKRFYNEQKKNVIIKPVKVGIADDESVVFTNQMTDENSKHLRQSAFLPSIYQENIQKRFDVRITVIGREVFATEIHSQGKTDSQIDWRKSQDIRLPHCKHKLPEDVKIKCRNLIKKLGLKFGAIDMILSNQGKYYFLEINPNGQWAWIEKRTGHKLTEALTDMLISREG